MKKKFMLCAAALVAMASITLASCSNSPADQAISVMKEYAGKFENAQSKKELKSLKNECKQELKRISAENPDFKPNDSQVESIKQAENKLSEAYDNAYDKF